MRPELPGLPNFGPSVKIDPPLDSSRRDESNGGIADRVEQKMSKLRPCNVYVQETIPLEIIFTLQHRCRLFLF